MLRYLSLVLMLGLSVGIGKCQFTVPEVGGSTVTNVSAWPANDGSGLLIHDVSGNNNTVNLFGPTRVTWQSNAGFPGITAFWTSAGFGQATSATLTNFDGTKSFSAGMWLQNSVTNQGAAYVSSLNTGAGFQGWEVSRDSAGHIVFFLINTYPTNALQVNGTPSVNNTAQHYVLVSYHPQPNGDKKAAGVAICVDGLDQSLTVAADTLTGTSANGTPLFLGARQDNSTPYAGVMAFIELYPYVVPTTQCAINFALGPAIY